MEKERAKKFLFCDLDSRKLYVSKDLQTLLDLNAKSLIDVYAIVETESGDTLCNMDWAYSGEPIIMGRFIHLKYFLDHYWNFDIVNV